MIEAEKREPAASISQNKPQESSDAASFPIGWRVETLDRVATVQTGVAKGRQFANEEMVDVPYLRVANVQDGHLDLTEMKTISIRSSEVERYRLQNDDIVLTEGGDFDKLGRGFIWRGELELCVHQNHIFAVRPDREALLPQFLAYLVQSSYGKAYFLSVAHKTTNLACINSTKLKAFPVLVPPLVEQQRISLALDSVAKAVDVERRSVQQAEVLRRALIRHLFSGGAGGECAFGRIPRRWEETSLGALCVKGSGTIQTGPFGSQLHASDYEATGVPVINPTHLDGNRINHDDLPRVSLDTVSRLERHKLEAGDILFARRGEIGRHGLVTDFESGWLCGTGCFLVRVRDSRVSNAFLSYFFSTEGVVSWLSSNAAGTIMPNLNNTVLGRLPVLIPPMEEQMTICAILGGIEQKLALHKRRRGVLAELFRALLNKLLTGKIRVSDLNLSALEPASPQEVST